MMNSYTAGWQWVSCLRKSPMRRTEEDISIIFSKMKTLKVFEQYPEDILLELCRYTLHDTFLANTTLFKPGEEGVYWYSVIAGSLEMLDVDPNDSTKTNSICYLREGDSFGENVIFGECRHTMIVTTEYCELLYLEAHHIRRIYEAHKDRMERLIQANSCTSISPDPDDMLDGAGGKKEGEGGVAADTELAMAGVTLIQLIRDHFKELICDHKVNLHTYRQCCSGSKLVDWVISQSNTPRTRPQVVQMWQALLTEGVIQHVLKEHPFRDDPHLFYQFIEVNLSPDPPKPRHRWSSILFSRFHAPAPKAVGGGAGEGPEEAGQALTNGRPRSGSSFSTSPRSSRSSLSSLLEECFDTIAALGPESLIYAVLRKDPAKRTDDDVDMIFEELLHIRAFRHLSNAVKREISSCAKLDHYKKAGKYLYHQGDKGGSWYVILKGSVSLIIEGKGVVCTLHEGDEFGKLGVVNEAVRSSSVQVREENCYFLRIEREDFKRILLSVESTTVKFTEHGKDVLVLEKGPLGQYLIVKGTPEKMLSHLLESDIHISSQEETFAQDFFLTYPAFMSISDLCEELRKTYHGKKPAHKNAKTTSHMKGMESAKKQDSMSDEDWDKIRKRRVARAVCVWVDTAKGELVKDTVFLKLLGELQDSLPKDGLQEELNSLTASVASSIKHYSAGASSPVTQPQNSLQSFLKLQPRSKSVNSEHEIKMGISQVPPHQPMDKVHMRVHTMDHTCCRLQVKNDSTAREIVREACKKLKWEDHKEMGLNLCEVKSSGEVRVLNDKDVSIHSSLSANGRLYIVPKKFAEKTMPPLPDQNQKPTAPFPEKESARDIAVHLTVYDWNLFSNIQQMEYIYHMFGRHKFGKITTNLDLLLARFNQVQYWVETEIVREPDLVKRVNIIKKFIKVAGYCKSFNNLNSFFAVTIGLMSVAVTRLRQTWKEVPLKLKTRLEQFQALTDPSRNHSVLRALERKLAPPVIPFMPLVTKDAYFLHIGNETYVGDLVNFEKMRLVASNVRGLNKFKSGSLSQELRLTAHKNPTLQQYIRTLHVLDNDIELAQISHKVESPSRPASTAT